MDHLVRGHADIHIVQEGPACACPRRARYPSERRQSLASQAAYFFPRFNLSLHAHGVPSWWRLDDHAHQVRDLL